MIMEIHLYWRCKEIHWFIEHGVDLQKLVLGIPTFGRSWLLHGMMTGGSKQLSSTLQELRVTRTSSRMSRGTTIDEVTCSAPAGPDSSPPNKSAPTPPPHPLPPPPPPPPSPPPPPLPLPPPPPPPFPQRW
uniref:Uncharacterized protein n=1 Tax=Cacopsylla melanoneura TaxID=428564 RepID=A0A8D9ET26_9HEMI